MDIPITDWMMAVFTAVLVVFTWLLTRATKAAADAAGRSVDIGKQQIEDTRILQRAYISVEALGIDPFGETSWAHISVRNKGRLPARNVTWFIAYAISNDGTRRDFEIDENQFYGDKSVIPAESDMRRSQRCKFNAEKLNSFLNCSQDKRTFLFLWGEIRYLDGFDIQRFTKFCHRYDRLQMQSIGEGANTGKYRLPAESMRTHQFGNEAD